MNWYTDCICRLLILPNEDCYLFEYCYCAQDTMIEHSLRICRSTMAGIIQLSVCFSDLTEEMNNTRVFLFKELPMTNCASGPYAHVFYKAIQVITVEGIYIHY